ncbi:hypothetical protein PsorP6_005350 [Peronosclerospora sorghi]|uniref:Uncharacterized protein n=1 Tax=Peronosclerospora sorghi TaxID=230839 RepID=A0ACC0W3I8_9STRA|nr:hypothetical protein PsorP6_005350 [Peronosclerospora sorghi]
MDMLNSDTSAILFRVTELEELPIAIETAKQYVSNTRGLMDQWSTIKPQRPKPQPKKTDSNDTDKDGEDSKVDISSTHADDVNIDKEGQTELTDEKD